LDNSRTNVKNGPERRERIAGFGYRLRRWFSRCFTVKTLKEVLKRANFKIDKIAGDFICFNLGSIIFPPWSKFLGKIFPPLSETLIIKARKTKNNEEISK
jgi:hypothetical protein